MKKYIKPQIEFVTYDTTDTLNGSNQILKSGNDNLEFDYNSDWNDNII